MQIAFVLIKWMGILIKWNVDIATLMLWNMSVYSQGLFCCLTYLTGVIIYFTFIFWTCTHLHLIKSLFPAGNLFIQLVMSIYCNHLCAGVSVSKMTHRSIFLSIAYISEMTSVQNHYKSLLKKYISWYAAYNFNICSRYIY